MSKARFVTAAVLAAAAAAGGCGGGPRPPTAREEQRAFNATRLEGTPDAVKAAFDAQYPDAAITRVEVVPTGTGPLLYRVVYIDTGQPGTVTYRADGTRFQSTRGVPR